MALGDQPREGAARCARPAAAPGRRRARHHRAQAVRGGAVSREGERADHAAVDRRWGDHHRCLLDHRLHQPGGRTAHRLAARGCDGAAGGGDLPRLPRGDLRAAGESAHGLDPARAPDQVGAADAADPARRQRAVRREHRLADPRRQRQGRRRRAGVPRRQRIARAQSPPELSRQPRSADRPGQPARIRKPPGAGAARAPRRARPPTRCAIWISISSRSSTTPAATAPAMRCSARWARC